MQSQTKSNLFLWLSFTIITTIIIGGVGLYYYFIFQQDTLKNNDKNYSTGSNETDEWKTYTNQQYAYEIKYPSNWPLEVKKPESVIIGTVPYEPGPGFIGIDVYSNKNFQIYLDDYFKEFGRNYIEDDNCQQEKIPINVDLEATKMSCVEPFAGQNIEGYFIEKNNNLYYLHFIKNSDFNEIYNKILSTFKFTDSTSDETANWKTYTNKEYGFELKYPIEYEFTINKSPHNDIDFINFYSKQESTVGVGEPTQVPSYMLTISIEKTNDTLEKITDDFLEDNEIDDYKSDSFQLFDYIVDGRSAKIIKKYFGAMGLGDNSSALIIDNDNFYKINTLAYGHDDETFTDEVFDQIIASFKFIK